MNWETTVNNDNSILIHHPMRRQAWMTFYPRADRFLEVSQIGNGKEKVLVPLDGWTCAFHNCAAGENHRRTYKHPDTGESCTTVIGRNGRGSLYLFHAAQRHIIFVPEDSEQMVVETLEILGLIFGEVDSLQRGQELVETISERGNLQDTLLGPR